ncbi:BLUF domain-containing protein [Aquimarina aquimarini]|uniref:BLUF domain-containing protein n=1 Tax=Aquimarina aquimarini TaxID=1191734 RepID=UPI000D55C762|nr:BLUF domain-containing protein [Aquimarina aquimarini]
MKGIVYVSKAIEDFTPVTLHQLAEFASNCNEEHEITGYLYFEKKYFLQYIEGEKGAINRLINNIKNDARHEVLNVQISTDIKERKFPTWHMQQLTKSSLIQINMENVLMDYMRNCSKPNSNINEEHVWRMVDKLSGFRKKLSYSMG